MQVVRAGQAADAGADDDDVIVLRNRLAIGPVGTPVAHAEIKDLLWFGPQDDAALLAPSLRNIIFPDLRRRGLIAPASY